MKHFSNRLLTPLAVLVILATAMSVHAQRRSPQQALDVARQYFSGHSAANRSQGAEALQLVPLTEGLSASAEEGDGADAPYYIVNDLNGRRFVIVSGDDRQHAVLGASDQGVFDAQRIPCGLQMMLAQYEAEYRHLQQADDAVVTDAPRAALRRAFPSVAPLVSAQWDQGNNDPSTVGEEVFNRYCPTDPSTHKASVTGCVATAMAQILYTHRAPDSASGTVGYTTQTNKISLSENLADYPFYWSLMCDIYRDRWDGPVTTQQQREAVGRLMYACGLAVHTDYNSSGSSAIDNNVPYALVHYFGMNPYMQYLQRNYYTPDEWDQLLQEELLAGRPVLYGGQNPNNNSGHAFIVDGCNTDGTYHVNWGFNGDGNGSFRLSTLTSSRYYVSDQDMTVGISTSTIGTPQEHFYANSFSVSAASTAIGNTLSTSTDTPRCQCAPVATTSSYGQNTWSGSIGVAVFDTQWNCLREYPATINKNQTNDYTMGLGWKGNIRKNLTFSGDTFQDGCQYYIAPYARSATADAPTRMRTMGGASDWYLATVSGSTVTLTLLGTPDESGTAISTVSAEKSTDGPFFDLHGRRATPPLRPGIYLHQGKKVVVK